MLVRTIAAAVGTASTAPAIARRGGPEPHAQKRLVRLIATTMELVSKGNVFARLSTLGTIAAFSNVQTSALGLDLVSTWLVCATKAGQETTVPFGLVQMTAQERVFAITPLVSARWATQARIAR